MGQFFSIIVNWVYPAGPLTDLGAPNDDSELRFYSVFFVAYGVILVQTARDLIRHGHRLKWLLGLFFLGGLARLLSYLMVGPPHALFVLLMFIEILFPPILYALWRGMRTRSQPI